MADTIPEVVTVELAAYLELARERDALRERLARADQQERQMRSALLAVATSAHRDHFLSRKYHGQPGNRSFDVCKHELCVIARAALRGQSRRVSRAEWEASVEEVAGTMTPSETD